MELANATLNLAGDANQQVQKWSITPAEAAVLRHIHGQDALHGLTVIATVDRKGAVERERLVQVYGRGIDGQIRSAAVDALFPGLGARLPESFDELPDPIAAEEIEETEEVVTPVAPKKPAKKAKKEEPDAETIFE